MTSIVLSWSEIVTAAGVGVLRHVSALRNTMRQVNGADPDDWTIDIDGALAELAVAKHLQLPWDMFAPLGAFNRPDVGPYQVKANGRARRNAAHDDLIVKESDPIGDPYISVLNFPPRFEICGWIAGVEAKNKRYWCDRLAPGRDAYLVPRADLKSLETLPHLRSTPNQRKETTWNF